jgi:DNA-binding GntR family transcriptional regulator
MKSAADTPQGRAPHLALWSSSDVPAATRETAVPVQPQLVANGVLAPASLVELAVQRLRSDILSGALVPGDRLVEEQLTRRFGTSRAPLREALRLLGQQGLVEHLPRRGVRVAQLSPQDVDELFSLREVLERFAVQIAPPVPDPLALVELADRLEAMRQAATTGAALEQAEAHRRFHLALVAMAAHRHLLLVYEPVILKLQLYMAANLRREAQARSPQDGVRRHQRLFEAVAAGDVQQVLTALGDHGARSYFG